MSLQTRAVKNRCRVGLDRNLNINDEHFCCTPISDVASQRHVRSASRRQLLARPSTQSLHTWSLGFSGAVPAA